MGVCLCGMTARLPSFPLTSPSFAKVTDTLIIQFNSGWQLNLALPLWLYQCFAPRLRSFPSSGAENKYMTWQ